MEERWVYIDGEFIKKEEARISVFDHGFLYGDRNLRRHSRIQRQYLSLKRALGAVIRIGEVHLARNPPHTGRDGKARRRGRAQK